MDLNIDPADLVNSKVKMKLLRHIMDARFEMSSSDLAKFAALPVMTVNRVMKEYFAANLLHVARAGNTNIWRVNRESYAFRVLDGVYRALSGLEPPVEALKKLIKKTLSVKYIKRAVLFGSTAKGSSTVESDIDLFVLVDSPDNMVKAGELTGSLQEKVSRIYGNPLRLYMLDMREYVLKKNLGIIKEAEKGIKII
jgi:predicted nucleotidyltransferase